MHRELTRKFLPPHYYQDNFIQLQNLRQKSMSVEEYTRDFEKLMMKCDIQEKEEQMIARYLGGLNTNIVHLVQLQQYWSLDEVLRLAIRVEKQLPKKSLYQHLSSTRSYAHCNKPSTQEPSSLTKPPQKIIEENSSKTPRCFKCQGFGHIASDCPNPKTMTIIKGEIHEASEEEEEDIHEALEEDEMGEPIYDEEPVLADCGESLVVRRSLHTTIVKEEPWLRHNIFHTLCTSQGKVCGVSIERGSCENVVSNYMVERLKLPKKEHPHPYKLQWLNKDNEVRVSKRCLVYFSIVKKYKDNAWCDVIPMDACHLLLGRPWQYDRHALYDGYVNTYTFVKDGVKIKLVPLPPNAFDEGKNDSKLIVSLVLKEPYKDKTKFCMSRLIPKPPCEVVSMDFSFGLLHSLCYLKCC